MCSVHLEPGGNRDPRDIDRLASKTRSLWSRTYVFIKKANVKTWKKVFVLAFITGAIAAAVWMISLKIHTLLNAVGETSSLSLRSDKSVVGEGETFNVDIVLNSNSYNVVAVKAIVDFNPLDFVLQSWNTSSAIFAANNPCQYNGKACEIISQDKISSGQITITLAKPKPGVITTSGTVGTLTFKALRPVAAPSTPNITLKYVSTGNYDDSDVILDDGKGTDILTAVAGAKVTVSAPSCTSFTYSSWGDCQADGTQTRTITSSSPSGCTGGDPVLTQGCSSSPSLTTCTNFKYSKWSACVNGTRTRTINSSSPSGCTGGDPVVSQSCKGGK